MLIIRFFIPLLYSLMVGVSLSLIFNKKFIESIAPAYFLQILIMLLAGMAFGKVSIGIIAFLVILIIGDFLVLREKKRKNDFLIKIIDKNFSYSLILFVISYVFIYVINYGSHFSSWDEFSHWGMFIKETLRLDSLYCTSPLDMAHKDYVPVITLFEALWCKLSLRYSEADSYRGIQMLQMSMMLPIVCRLNGQVSNGVNKILKIALRFIIIIALPLYLTCQELFFYHTVYQDYIFGIMIFYSIYVIVVDMKENYKVHCFIVTLTATVLVMSKMVAMAYLPLLWLFYLIIVISDNNNEFALKKKIKNILVAGIVPVLFWVSFNIYVDRYIVNDGSGQSYDGIGIRKIIGILLHDGSISYQNEVEKLYINSLISRPIIGQLGYITVATLLTIGLLLFAFTRKSIKNRNEILFICAFNICSVVMYAIMMYVLYLTSFTEYEASYLASFTRYMSTPIIAILYSTIFCIFEYSEWIYDRKMFVIIIWVTITIILGTCEDYDQIKPGVILGEQAVYESEAEYILKNVEEDESVYLINRGDNGFFETVMKYSCNPIHFLWGSPGMPVNENDVYSTEYTIEELYALISDYDYIYFVNLDDDFVWQYSSLFKDEDKIVNGKLYKISCDDTKIELIDCMDL